MSTSPSANTTSFTYWLQTQVGTCLTGRSTTGCTMRVSSPEAAPTAIGVTCEPVIKRVRIKFGACDSAFDQIENYPGFGYCWKEPA